MLGGARFRQKVKKKYSRKSLRKKMIVYIPKKDCPGKKI